MILVAYWYHKHKICTTYFTYFWYLGTVRDPISRYASLYYFRSRPRTYRPGVLNLVRKYYIHEFFNAHYFCYFFRIILTLMNVAKISILIATIKKIEGTGFNIHFFVETQENVIFTIINLHSNLPSTMLNFTIQ